MPIAHVQAGVPHPAVLAISSVYTISLCTGSLGGGGFVLGAVMGGLILKSVLRGRQQVREVGSQAERLASHCLQEWDDDLEGEDSGVGDSDGEPLTVRLIVRGREYARNAGMSKRELIGCRLVRRAADYARMKVGLPKDNEANRLVVRRLVQEYLDGVKDLRLSHRKVIEPAAVAMAFIPTETDVLVADMEASAAFSRRREEMWSVRVARERPWWSHIPGLGGFARVHTRAPVGR